MHIYLTQERYDELAAEVSSLKKNGRRMVADRLRQAKELGDLSENFEYQEAREEQSRVEQRIIQIEDLLRNGTIIKKAMNGATIVRIGSKVTLEKDKKNIIYTVVGSNEAKPAEGLISNESPLGRSLLGKKVGDNATIKTLKGEAMYQIMSIE